MEQHFVNFLQKVRKTKNARFEAYRRMKRRKMSSNLSLCLLSFSMIVFNIFQLSPIFGKYHTSITFVTIILSALILAISLLVNNLNYGERELKYYQCGLALSRMEDELNQLKNQDENIKPDLLTKKISEYHDCLSGWGINHISTDHKIAILKDTIFKSILEELTQKLTQNGTKINNLKSCCILIKLFFNKSRHKIWRFLKIIWYSIWDVNILYWLMALIIPALGYFLIFQWNIFAEKTSL